MKKNRSDNISPFRNLIQASPLEKGQSLVELAVGFLILMLLISGIANLGGLLFYYLAMRDAVQEGASYGIIHPTHCDQIVQRAASSLNDSNPLIDINVLIDNIPC
jgi:hypothetical protein